MAGCNTAPTANKACSGKCLKNACADNAPRVGVVAACDGMISLFERTATTTDTISVRSVAAAFPTLAQFHATLLNSNFDQLVLVGSAGDIAWIHSTLPEAVSRHIAAEIKYPLMAQWFRDTAHPTYLVEALGVALR